MLDQTTKVFGIGLSKTGTSSLGRALNQLGISSIHYPHDPTTFAELAAANYRLTILEKYQSITDIPIVPFYPQLDAMYPGSKFILTVRDLDGWLTSIEHHWEFMRSWAARDVHFRRFSEFITACVYGAYEFQTDRFTHVYHQHAANVEDYFADRPRDLLVLDICGGDGWEVLCPFLNLPIPDTPFPHANRREDKGERREWMDRLDDAAAELQQAVPRDQSYILVDDNQLAGSTLERPGRVRRILERNGEYWGNPSDADLAVRELQALRDQGARYLVVAWTSAWWLDYYDQLAQFLDIECAQTFVGNHLTVYDLSMAPTE